MENMDNQDANNTAAVSSTDAVASAQTGAGVGANIGAAPVPQDEVKRKSLLDVIRSAVNKRLADAESSPAANGSSPDYSRSGDSDLRSGSNSDDNVPFHNHPRWKEIMREREELKQKSKQYEEISEYMRANGLSSGELAQGFEVMALMKNDPARAKEVLNMHMQRLAQFTGEILPKDIQLKLDMGEIDEASATELAALRARSQVSQHQVQQSRTEAPNANEQVSQRAMYDAVVQWEQVVGMRDAEYKNKQAMVTDRVKAMMMESGRPTNPQQAVEYVQRAYEEVNQRLGPLAGRSNPVRVVSSANSSSGSSAPQPRSLREAISWAAKRHT